MREGVKRYRIFAWIVPAMILFGIQAEANNRGNMRAVCTYEAQRAFGLPKWDIRTLPPERRGEHFVVFGSGQALEFKCGFNRWGEFNGIKKIRDTHYRPGGGHTGGVPGIVRRICKGEASARWRMRPREIRIEGVKRLGHRDFVVALSGRGYHGRCEVSRSGHIYQFTTRQPGYGRHDGIPKAARHGCKRYAAARWGIYPREISISNSRRLGRNDFGIELSSRYGVASCEVSANGRVYRFMER